MLDGSKSVDEANFAMQTDFAADLVEVFDTNMMLLYNGEKSFYVQYASSATSAGPFGSASDFKTHAYEAGYIDGASTAIAVGISAARQLIIGNTSAASIMVVITDGQSNEGGLPGPAADLARLAGIDVFAVGVGEYVGSNARRRRNGLSDKRFYLSH